MLPETLCNARPHAMHADKNAMHFDVCENRKCHAWRSLGSRLSHPECLGVLRLDVVRVELVPVLRALPKIIFPGFLLVGQIPFYVEPGMKTPGALNYMQLQFSLPQTIEAEQEVKIILTMR